jgi:hypothetical protein
MRRASATTILVVLSVLGWTLLPAHGPLAPQPTSAAGFARVTVGAFTFEIGEFTLTKLPIEALPFYGPTLVSGCGITDGSGVAMYRTQDGLIVDHPVAQAQCAVNMLRNYRITMDAAYLELAKANAQRLLDRAVHYRGADFFPYPFRFVNAGRGIMEPPWYSAMAQGIGMSAFVRLWEWTGDAKWSSAADRAFAALKIPRGYGTPWVTGVEDGRIWFDEYPTTPLDRVFNGHNFTLYGIYDYWRAFDSDEARLLLLGGLHSSYLAAVTRVRIPGGISQYCISDACLSNKVRNPAYHITHIGQLQKLADITDDWRFASLSEAFVADSPRTGPGRALMVSGTHDGYTFNASGIGTMVKRATLAVDTETRYSRRDVPGGAKAPGNGVWLLMGEGPLQGLWVRESRAARPLGFTDESFSYWGRPVRVDGGTYVGRSYSPDGSVVDQVTATAGPATWTYSEYARVNGDPSVLLTSGPLAGHWLVLDARTLRDSTLFSDVDFSIFRTDIIWLTTQSITRGCTTWAYCPEASVTREQMASFLVRSLRLPATTTDFFTDDDGRPAEGDINRLAASGITAGCSSGRFCPSRPLTRAEMASLLARALALPQTQTDFFADDNGSQHEGDINRLAASGITAGCAPDRFCPTSLITRGQLAALLHRALARPGSGLGGPSSAATQPASGSLDPIPTGAPSAPATTPSSASSASPETTSSLEPKPTPAPTPPGSDSPVPSVITSPSPDATSGTGHEPTGSSPASNPDP